MTAFLLHLFFRVLSGSANAAFYARRNALGLISCIVYAGAAIALSFSPLPIIASAFFGLSGLAAIGKAYGFMKGENIHFWENLVIVPIPFAIILSGGSVAMVALSLYPGLMLHKILINIGSGLPALADETDDPTGKTYGIPFPKWLTGLLRKLGIGLESIAVPRTTQYFRLFMGLVSVALAALYLRLDLAYGLGRLSIFGINL